MRENCKDRFAGGPYQVFIEAGVLLPLSIHRCWQQHHMSFLLISHSYHIMVLESNSKSNIKLLHTQISIKLCPGLLRGGGSKTFNMGLTPRIS